MIICKSEAELDLMREAGRIVAETHRLLTQAIRPGITTENWTRSLKSSFAVRVPFLLLKAITVFLASICASVNEELVHGIPGPTKADMKATSSASISARSIKGITAILPGPIRVGEISEEAQRLLDVTEAIAVCRACS